MITALDLYNSGMLMLNATRANKMEAYKILQQAADMGHSDALLRIAWAKLMGSTLPQDFNAAKETFEKLADKGIGDAHMVNI